MRGYTAYSNKRRALSEARDFVGLVEADDQLRDGSIGTLVQNRESLCVRAVSSVEWTRTFYPGPEEQEAPEEAAPRYFL